MNPSTLSALKYGSVASLFLASTLTSYLLAKSTDTFVHRAYFRYTADLERKMRLMFIDTKVIHVVLGQLLFALLSAGLALALGAPLLFALVGVSAVTPRMYLEYKRKKRVAAIEQKLEGFVLALANALRASPSAGRALAMVQPITPPPLDREIELVLREMRVGSTLEQALANLSARVRSFQVDAAMSCLLIGRQTGGDVPRILDGAAHTLREITRLQGVLRSKTAEGRSQANVLTVFPLALIFGFEWVKPGYFEPMLNSPTGVLISIMAIGMWVSSIVLVRRIMAVEL